MRGPDLQKVEIKWYRIDDTGTETEYFNHKLEGVKICSVKPIMYNVKDPSKEKYVHLEEVQMRYQKITWTYTTATFRLPMPGRKRPISSSGLPQARWTTPRYESDGAF